MISARYTPTFVRMYLGLDQNLKEEIRESIELFRIRDNHTKLKVHKLKGIENAYSFSVNYKIRIIFEYENKQTVNLIYIGFHDEVY